MSNKSEIPSGSAESPLSFFLPIVFLISRIGRWAISVVGETGKMGVFLGVAVFYVFAPPLKFMRFLKQLQFIGFQSILLIALSGAFTGMVLAFQGYYTLVRVGSSAMLGPMVALSLLRELGPVITALMVTGRAGSAITAEIGIMRISEEVDAMELMGLNPYRYLVVPNLLAAIIAMPLLTALFDTVGIFGGYLVGVKLLGLGAGTYYGEMHDYVKITDITDGIYKALCFGGIIAWVCCFKGFFSGYGAEGVSKATTQAVVMSSVLILIWDYFMTSVMF